MDNWKKILSVAAITIGGSLLMSVGVGFYNSLFKSDPKDRFNTDFDSPYPSEIYDTGESP